MSKQILGKRMGLVPYYTDIERRDMQLILRSEPGANAHAGYLFMGCGGLLTLFAISLFCMTFISSMEDFGAFFSGMMLSWPCGVVGGLAIIGGLAIARTVNTITINPVERTIIYTQTARRERKQTLMFDAIRCIQLSQQWFRPLGFFKRRQLINVLECVTVNDEQWLIDSAAEEAALLPVAHALTDLMGVPLTIVPANDTTITHPNATNQ